MISNIVCDKCNQDFIIDDISFRALKGDLQAQEFTCPHCGARYLVLLTDGAIRQKMDDMARLATRQRALISKHTRIKTLFKYNADIKQMSDDIKRMCDALKKKHKAKLKDYINT